MTDLMRELIEEKLVEAMAEPSEPMTREDWEDIRREGMKIIEERKACNERKKMS